MTDPERSPLAQALEVADHVATAEKSVAPVVEVKVRHRGEWKWRKHPVFAETKLTFGQRAADMMREGMGSWPFVFAFFAVLAGWMLLNSHLLLGAGGHKVVDPYPWILENLGLSMLAGVQGAILLISAKRQDQISSEVAIHTEGNTEDLKKLLEQNTALTGDVRTLAQALHDHMIGAGS